MNSSRADEQASQKQAQRKLASGRHKARHFAMQALYQNQFNQTSAVNIEAQFRVDFDMKGTDFEYFRELISGTQTHTAELDAQVEPHFSDLQLEECDPVTRALLRIGVYELRFRIDVPYKVAINEAVNLAKKFGPAESHKFVNGVLDKAARQLREPEVSANSR